jgi:hypothetical protein
MQQSFLKAYLKVNKIITGTAVLPAGAKKNYRVKPAKGKSIKKAICNCSFLC